MPLTELKDDEDFRQQVIEQCQNLLILVYFYAPWCGPCKIMSPKMEELQSQYPNVTIYKINVDTTEDLISEYELAIIPSTLFFYNKELLEKVLGSNIEKVKDVLLSYTEDDGVNKKLLKPLSADDSEQAQAQGSEEKVQQNNLVQKTIDLNKME